jgi:hypothetical protein
VHLAFETGGKARRVAGELFWRKAELRGKDKPQPPSYLARIASERIAVG